MMNEFSLETVHGEPPISVSVSETYADHAEAIISFLDTSMSQGKGFRDGQTIQFGWVMLKLIQGMSGRLEVWEPDFESMPVKWTKGVDKTLRFTLIQREVCARMVWSRTFHP